MEGWVAHADVIEFSGLDDPVKNSIFVVLGAQRKTAFHRGVVGDNRSYVLERLSIDVATHTLPTIDLAGQ